MKSLFERVEVSDASDVRMPAAPRSAVLPDHRVTDAGFDPLFDLLLRETNDVRRERIIEALLVDDAADIITRTLRRKVARAGPRRLGDADVDDARSIVVMRLLRRFRNLAAGEAIRNFEAYVTTVTSNVWDELVRERQPQRTLLKNRIRYVLLRDAAFALWHAGNELHAGFAEWQQRDAVEIPEGRDVRVGDASPLPALLRRLFLAAGGPLELESIVTIAAEALNIADHPPEMRAAEGEHREPFEDAVVAEAMEGRDLLAKLWREIAELPPQQRTALLLGLRDGEGDAALPLFLTTGVAAIDEIAAAIGLTAPELASLFNELPLEDNRIAGMLDITRQQVINLRSAARKRLARRRNRF